MSLPRRRFLGLGLGGTALAAGCAGVETPVHALTGLEGEAAWERVRGEFELDPAWAHFAGFLLASHPRIVRAAIDRHQAALDLNPAHHYEACRELGGEIRTSAAEFLGVPGQGDQIALTDSTTMGLGLVYGGAAAGAGHHRLDDALSDQLRAPGPGPAQHAGRGRCCDRCRGRARARGAARVSGGTGEGFSTAHHTRTLARLVRRAGDPLR